MASFNSVLLVIFKKCSRYSGPENLKKSRPKKKKLVKSNKPISRKNFFKTAKNAISRKFLLIYLISQVFFAWTFLNFLAHCAYPNPRAERFREIAQKK